MKLLNLHVIIILNMPFLFLFKNFMLNLLNCLLLTITSNLETISNMHFKDYKSKINHLLSDFRYFYLIIHLNHFLCPFCVFLHHIHHYLVY